MSTARTSTTGKPASTPLFIISSRPCTHAWVGGWVLSKDTVTWEEAQPQGEHACTYTPSTSPHLDHTRDVLLGHHAALDLAAELEARASVCRLKLDADVGKLAAAAGLLLVNVAHLGGAADALAIIDLRAR
jgi:hypothetical protein